MIQIIVSISALLIGVMLMLLGNGLLGTLVGVRLSDADVPTALSGVVLAFYFAGLFVGAFLARAIIHGVGHIRAFSAFASLFSAATLGHAFLEDAIVWSGLRFIAGLCMAGLYICAESWLNEKATNATRGAVLSLYSIVSFLAMGVGQFLITLYDPAGFALFAVASVLLSLALVPVALSRVPGPALPPLSVFRFSRLWEISPLAVVAAVSGGLILGSFLAMGPVYARQIGFSVDGVALFMASAILGAMLLQWPVGRASDFFDRRKVIVGLCLTIAASSLGVARLGAPNDWLTLGLMVVFGAGMFILYSMAIAHANDYVDTADLVPAAGGLLLSYSVGATVGPLVSSAAMDTFGPAGLFHTCAVIGFLTAVFGVYRLTRRASLPLEEQAPFVVVPRTSTVATELDPRGAEHPEPGDEDPEAEAVAAEAERQPS